MFYLDLFRALQEHGVRYLLIGGVAVNLHGAERMTMDVDLMLSFEAENLQRFLGVVRRFGMKPVVPVTIEQFCDAPTLQSWIREKGLLAFALRPAEIDKPTVDILVQPVVPFEAAYVRRVTMQVQDVAISVAAPDDLIALKSGTGRLIDESDIRALHRLAELRARRSDD